jgi:YegS/Rv2252/BmrU family lipid kinase
MSNYKFIVNPAASRGKGNSMGKWLEKECQIRNLDFDIQYTTRPGDASEIAANSTNDFKNIIAVGGDGTLQEVINGLNNIDINIGIIPVGTGNDFVRAMNIPIEPQKALNTLIGGHIKQIDAGKVGERIFHNGVGIGFDAWVVYESLKIKMLRGHAIYLYSIIKTLKNYKAPLMELKFNDKSVTKKLFLITVGNGTSLGGGIKLTPFAKMDDGLLDLNIIQDVNKFKILQNLLKAYSGEHVNMPEVTVDKCKSIVVKSDEGLAVHADGELISCKLTEVNIQIIPKAIKFVVPKNIY